jgi:hypothetical protein
MPASPTAPVRWLDFSGAPPMLIPRRVATLWRGTTDPEAAEYRDLDTVNPVTDYDRACAAAWPGRSVLQFHGAQILVLYTEFDAHTWDGDRRIVACGGWLPPDVELQRAVWSDPIEWRVEDADLLLMNSAADGAGGQRNDDCMSIDLAPGIYTVEFSYVESEYTCCFHRFRSRSAVAQPP